MDPLWFKDAIIYEAHVRAFADSNGDGAGDFAGLTSRLPYLQDLGITCLWLLPFYPSPLRDDGYDIADYTSINPLYGTLDDFKRFLDASHSRGIRVLTELVINHTSDQHPWFQRARHAARGSAERDFYVWSDTDTKYAGTRIIFVDTETSNWTFDPVAGQYYWHRFFSHQPDLNFDNPAVLEAVLDVMRFWLELGVDALRLDAVPYLIEREGTINENLPETHAVLKAIRRELDARFTGRVLLAEANQWPSDVRAYFGDGDECHMCFHFPLMPRMFMALRQEERHPVVEIMNGSPEIPDGCQWALFLRNHDELTLEMVTDEERDYMYGQYAADPQMRLNVGIRRRLAPLMENSRPRIELMNSLLFSMPGTPIIYYGDEIGMGDNVYLGDRNGVRTPMQWNSDRNAGFSRADPARLYFPVIMDPVYGYEAINVDAQERSPWSLLHWMKRMIALRRRHAVFGRGSLEFIRTDNRKVLTYVRRHEGQTVLCVANLARTVQPVTVPVAEFAGLTPVELLGETVFPALTDEPYFLTLAPYGFYWFQLQESAVSQAGATATPEEPVERPTLLAGPVWDSVLDGGLRTLIERQALVPFLTRQRWFGAKARPIATVRVADWVILRRDPRHPAFLAIVDAHYTDGGTERYMIPLAMASGPDADALEQHAPHAVLAHISGARKGLLYDGMYDDGLCLALVADLQHGRELSMRAGVLRATAMTPHAERVPTDALAPIVRGAADQSNTSVLFGQQFVMKLFRRTEPGPNPDVEICRFLTEQGFSQAPTLAGVIEYEQPGDAPSSIAMLQRFIWNQGNGWKVTLEELGRYFERATVDPPRQASRDEVWTWIRSPQARTPDEVAEAVRAYLAIAEVLGRRTGELHTVLASGTGDAFAPEPFAGPEIDLLAGAMRRQASRQLQLLERALPSLDTRSRGLALETLARAGAIRRHADALARIREAGLCIRCHGDYHLGQVLINEGDVIIIDFEGEPTRPLAERRTRWSPLRDVASMIRSFAYASHTGVTAATRIRPEDAQRLAPWALLWETWVGATFLRAYLQAAQSARILPADPEVFDVLLRAFVIDKALYELGYELNSRPDWVHVPLSGLLSLTAPPHAPKPALPHA